MSTTYSVFFSIFSGKFSRPYNLCFASFSSISTRIISGPIFTILHHGIKNSQSLPKKPQNFPGPGIIKARMQPSFSSMSRSRTIPRHFPSQILMTSFSCNSQKRIGTPKTLSTSYAKEFRFIPMRFLVIYNIFYTLKRNKMTSPSFTTYSFPSIPTSPFSLAADRLPSSNKSL